MTIKDGRQWATSLSEIRRDHVERYRWAAKRVAGLVVDLGCGIGYGAKILADAGMLVTAVDISNDALEFGLKHWNHGRILRVRADLDTVDVINGDWAICFEVIEHLREPHKMLEMIAPPRLLCSVPNQDVMAFDPVRHSYHHRHYTRGEFETLLKACGWRALGWYGQEGKQSIVARGINGMTLIAECAR